MSELKVYGFCSIGDFLYQGTNRGQPSNETLPYYLKSEADKVIAHQKYKRCLAMAMYCHESAMWLEDYGNTEYATFMLRWHNRWLELAEKFKPNKEAK